MTSDISLTSHSRWAARTASGLIFVNISDDDLDPLAQGDLITIRNDAGEIVAARLIGPVAGESPEPVPWRIDSHWRVDDSGEPLATIVPETELSDVSVKGHDWGALGLPYGLDSRIRPAGDVVTTDEATLAHASSGHRILDHNPLLTMSPGDRVAVDGLNGIVVTIDRRKRTVEIDRDGEVTVHEFDDVQTQETA